MSRAQRVLDRIRAQSPDPESTPFLLERARNGDDLARDRLLARYLPVFRRWAHGRLPARARDLAETDDLVQNSLLKAFQHMEQFVPRREGAFLSYLRQIFVNEIRQEIRRVDRLPRREELGADLQDREPTPLEQLLGRRTLEVYEAALERFPEKRKIALVLWLELGFTYEQIAEAVGCPSANAARMLVKRALLALAEDMERSEEHA